MFHEFESDTFEHLAVAASRECKAPPPERRVERVAARLERCPRFFSRAHAALEQAHVEPHSSHECQILRFALAGIGQDDDALACCVQALEAFGGTGVRPGTVMQHAPLIEDESVVARSHV